MDKSTIAFIGAGNLAYSVIKGFIASGGDPTRILVSNRSLEKLHYYQSLKINTSQDNREVVAKADTVFLAVKPKDIKKVCEEIAPLVTTRKPLIVSVAAGITVPLICRWLQTDVAIVRVMPNTPCAVGAGATALYANPFVSASQKNLVETIMRSVGLVLWLSDESLMDGVTALSGAGPAYVFLFIEALRAAGIFLGLTKEQAGILTAETVLGAARLVLESDEDVVELREAVTSPQGTTEKALAVLESNDFRDLVLQAVQAAFARSREIAKEWNEK